MIVSIMHMSDAGWVMVVGDMHSFFRLDKRFLLSW